MRNCPYCGEKIEELDSKCVFCGSTVEPAQISETGYQNNIEDREFLSEAPKNSLSNGFKVFITIISTIPIIGQLIGIIMGIIYMNDGRDSDKKSFGKALLIATLIIIGINFLFFIGYIIFAMYALYNMPELLNEFRNFQ